MCGRYSISKKAREIGDHFRVIIPPDFQGQVYNAAPTQFLPVIAMDQPSHLQMFQWGLSAPWENFAGESAPVINARSESLREKKMFNSLLDTQRCIIPADGFFEWEKAGRIKQPWRFQLKNEDLFAFAGLFNQTRETDGSLRFSFSIITTRANSLLDGIHNRMPVILDRESHKKWFSETNWNKLEDILQPYPAINMNRFKVSPKVNSAAVNLPELILPWQDPNLTLF